MVRVFHGGVVEAYQERDVELARLGHTVTLIVPKNFQELPEMSFARERNDEIVVIPVSLWGTRRNPFYFYNPLQIAGILRRMQPEIIDLHEEPYSLAAWSVVAARALAGSRAKVIFRSSQNVFKKYPYPFSSIQSWVLNSSSAAYVPSAQARSVLERKGFSAPVSVIGNGVTLVSTEQRRVAPRDYVSLLYVGRLIPRKGIVDLMMATILLGGRARLRILGSGPMAQELAALIIEKDATDYIEMVDAVAHEEVGVFMLGADVICVPSHELKGWSEQFSRALVEGMANYCIPLVSNSGALPEVSGGIRPPFKWGDVMEMTREIEALCEIGDMTELKEAAHMHAVSNYSWQATSGQISAIYENIVLNEI